MNRHSENKKQVNEKILKVINHQENVNQSYNKLSPHTFKDACYKKKKKISINQDMDKREILYTVVRNVNWYTYC